MIGWLLFQTALAGDICASGCTWATVQEAVDSLAVGESGLYTIDPGYYDQAVLIDGQRSVSLLNLGIEPAVLSAPPGSTAVLEVTDGASLTLTGVHVGAESVRGIDASVGADVSVNLGLIYGTGVTGEGSLIRAVDSTLDIFAVALVDGATVGRGGQIYAQDSDIAVQGSAFEGGTGLTGGAISASASGSRRTITLSECTFTDNGSVTDGGALYLDGELDVSMESVVFQGNTALNGAVLAVGPGVVVDGVSGVVSLAIAFMDGGALYQTGGEVHLTDWLVSESAGTNGGAIALHGGDLVVDRLVVRDSIVAGQGGALYAAGGAMVLEDTVLIDNVATEGGGLWVGPDAELTAFVRGYLCGNDALTGGGAELLSDLDMELRNVRAIDNLAFSRGGAIRHSGPGTLMLTANHVLGNTSSTGGAGGVSTDGALIVRDTLIGFSGGGPGVRRTGDVPVAYDGGTAWWRNEQGDGDDLLPTTPGAIFTEPLLSGYTPGLDCLNILDYPGWYGSLRDAGSAGVQDLDGTRADIGAFGGPDSDPTVWVEDEDGDGSPVLYDCDETDPAAHPLADDPPYDGLDQNCDGADDFDADADGHRPPEYGGDDCDDERADVYPGAPEVASDPPVDQNCDGRFDADMDGFEPPEDCDDSDPDAYPGAVDGDPYRDLDCDGFVDGPQLTRPASCSTSGPPTLGWLALLGPILARRR